MAIVLDDDGERCTLIPVKVKNPAYEELNEKMTSVEMIKNDLEYNYFNTRSSIMEEQNMVVSLIDKHNELYGLLVSAGTINGKYISGTSTISARSRTLSGVSNELTSLLSDIGIKYQDEIIKYDGILKDLQEKLWDTPEYIIEYRPSRKLTGGGGH